MEVVKDNNLISLGKEQIDNLFWELNKELRRKMKKLPRDVKADLYVVGGACVVA